MGLAHSLSALTPLAHLSNLANTTVRMQQENQAVCHDRFAHTARLPAFSTSQEFKLGKRKRAYGTDDDNKDDEDDKKDDNEVGKDEANVGSSIGTKDNPIILDNDVDSKESLDKSCRVMSTLFTTHEMPKIVIHDRTELDKKFPASHNKRETPSTPASQKISVDAVNADEIVSDVHVNSVAFTFEDEEEVIVVDGPSVSTEQPSVSTEQPSVSTEQPSVSTEQSSVPTEQPSVPTVQPSVATVQPSVPTVQPSVATVQPSVSTEQSSVATVQPSVATVQPSVATVQPSVSTEQPSVSTEQSSVPTEQPSVPTEQPSVPTEQPSVPTEQPSVPTEQPSVPTEQPSVPTEQPSVSTEQPSVSTELSSVPTEQSSVPTEQSSVSTEQPSVSTEQPSVPTEQPSVPTEQPSVSTVQPSVATVQPSVATVQPSVATVQPSVTTRGPSVATVYPSVTTGTAVSVRHDNHAVGNENTMPHIVIDLTIDDEYEEPIIVDDCVLEVERYEASKLQRVGPYSLEEFSDMWKQVEFNLGETTESIENGKLIRSANSTIGAIDTDVQTNAQYGRLLPSATENLLTNILGLKQGDVFLDVGHGIGNVCLQAAYTIGCEARGIEIVDDRHFIAQQFSQDLAHQNKIRLLKDSIRHSIGRVYLRQGRLEDSTHRTFLTSEVTGVFANNFNGVFRERSSGKTRLWFLDDFLAGLFALMPPGTRLATLHPLPLCHSRTDANQWRMRHGLSESQDASFFEFEETDLGEARYAVSWSAGGGNTKPIKVFKYTRVRQSVDHSVFLCCNPSCANAKDAVPIFATTENKDGRVVLHKCECGYEAINLRSRRAKKQD